ncbi:hypothetical protein BVRB_9g215770 [Beta vulgaris subsp. vulgaris]|uniref:uncharacterized protein LOC104904080 n=1 Tax=Beta vulgaris subsp. vulgaris TaxID=3555 RepID=UPI00053F3556|nr:uncharacterized protein LOC104904080 [Beta vulgaris subsp. vulgaris]KMT01581.1 hypothetical protein BVRB_9g215770 [Beta vulgaris subsp. vulgaris]
MSSIVQTIQHRTTNKSLPISSSPSDNNQPSLRRRLSSLSLKLHPSISSSPATSWALHRSKSLSSMGENAGSSIKKWWDLGWAWVLSRKPTFVQDLEMNEEEKHVLGFHNRGNLRHLFFKVKSEVRKLLRYDDMSLPQTFNKYDGIRRTSTFA